jgi:transposase
MNKDEFLSLDINNQVEYINNKTITGLTISEVAEKIGMNESSIRRIVKKYNYVFNRKSKVYELSGNTKLTLNDNKSIIPKVIQKHNKNITEVAITKDNNLIKEVRELLDMKEQLKELILYHNRSKSIIDVIEPLELKIDKNLFKGDLKGRLIKVYDNVNNDWIEFCKNNNQFKMQDLYSMALLEYIEKYSKE